MQKVPFDAVSGQSDRHIDFQTVECPVHRDLQRPLTELKNAATEQGFRLRLASGYRSFERQLLIWNAKARGERPVVDSRGEVLELSLLSDEQLMYAILRWSALPGGSRHHWGTDLDIYDAAAVDEHYRVQLTRQECEAPGPFSPLHTWLDTFLPASDWFRPYGSDTGGVAPEAWHLSYKPLASRFYNSLDLPQLRAMISGSDIELKKTILANIEHIYERYVLVQPGQAAC